MVLCMFPDYGLDDPVTCQQKVQTVAHLSGSPTHHPFQPWKSLLLRSRHPPGVIAMLVGRLEWGGGRG